MELVATRQGFKDRRVRVGQTFTFDENETVQARDTKTGKPVLKDGKPVLIKVRVPKWAAPAAEAQVVIDAESQKLAAQAFDTKPAAARRAVRAKAEGADSLA